MRPWICVRPGRELATRRNLFAALSQWLEIDFYGDSGRTDSSGEIHFVATAADGDPFVEESVAPTFVCVSDAGARRDPHTVTWSDVERVPPALRGQRIRHTSAAVLPPSLRGEILASSDAGAMWVHRSERAREIEFVSSVPEEIPEGSYLYDQLKLDQWLRWLPLIHFVRRIAARRLWLSPGVHALFMFDDPNLHRPTYGSIDYAALAEHAEHHNYHAAMATVPSDAWGTSSKTVALFRTHPTRLSLLVHGNNHTRSELAQPYTDAGREQLVAQSLKRVVRLEQRSGLVIPRVMAAPHGACSESMASELLRQGYEAACISWGSLRAHNPHKAWSPSFGLQPAEFLGSGLPIIPRFRLSHSCLPDLILAAFLGQPIIPVGHHGDVAGGLDLLAEISAAINRIGQVTWCNMGQIALSNIKTRIVADTLEVLMFARSIRLDLPEGVTKVRIKRAWIAPDGKSEPLEVRFRGAGWAQLASDEIAIGPERSSGTAIEVRSVFGASVDYQAISSPAFRPWPVLRRILAEARDRLQPVITPEER